MSLSNTALFVCLDDFAKLYQAWERHRLIPTAQKRQRSGKLSLGEMLFIMVMFHTSGYRCFKLFYLYDVCGRFGEMLFIMVMFHTSGHRCFKLFYLYDVCGRYRHLFSDTVSYGRFVSLMPRLFLPLCALLHHLSGEETGLYIADSTSLSVCHPRRIHRHKVFEGLAQRGKTTMGWFFGLKLHIVINDKGQIMAVKITSGNTDDRAMLESMLDGLKGKCFADKGYISKQMFHRLWKKGIHLITGIRKNMTNYLMPMIDKIMLRKRFLVETVFDTLKSHMGLHHTRHRSITNAAVHIISCIAAYQLKSNKPTWT